MMRKNILILLVFTLFFSCNLQHERKIKLSSSQTAGLMTEKIATIQIAAAKKRTFAVLHFRNNTRNRSLDWLEQGLVEMLATDLSQSRQLNIPSSEKVVETVQRLGLEMDDVINPENGLRVARALKAEAFICGQYSMRNDSLLIELDLRDGLTGELKSRELAVGPGLENIFTMVDNITRNLRNTLQVQLKEISEIDQNIADFMTKSVDAYKYYSLGVETMNKFYLQQAIPYFEKAIQYDSTFASAYWRLAVLYFQYKDREKAHQLLSKAIKHSDNAPVKERYNILALEAITRGDLVKGIELYKKITEMFPEDDEAHFMLGNYYRGLRYMDKAIEQLEAAIALNPENKLAYNLLAYSYSQKGKVKLALETIQKYIDVAPNEPNPWDSRGEILQNAGRLKEAIEAYKKAIKIDKEFHASIVHLASAYLDEGKSKKASKIAQGLLKASKSNIDKTIAYRLLALCELEKGDSQKSLDYLHSAYTLDPTNADIIQMLDYIDPDSLANIARLQNWIAYEKSKLSPYIIAFSPFFRVIMFCFKYQYQLDTADSMLTFAINHAPSPNAKQVSLAFRQILEMYQGTSNPETQRLMNEISQKYGIMTVTKIPWDFWRYYFEALYANFKKFNISEKHLIHAITYAQELGNEHFATTYTIAAAGLSEALDKREAADSLMQTIGLPREDLWYICGPFEVTKGFHESFYPEQAPIEKLFHNQADQTWSQNFDGLLDGYIDLRKLSHAGFNRAVYACLPLYSPRNQTIQMRLGVNKPIKVWLNNKLVFIQNMKISATLDDCVIPVSLRQGMNYVLVKESAIVGEMGFYCRFTDKNGKGISDIRFGSRPQICLDKLK